MRRLARAMLLVAALAGCAELPRVGVVITNAPSSLGGCMPGRPGACP